MFFHTMISTAFSKILARFRSGGVGGFMLITPGSRFGLDLSGTDAAGGGVCVGRGD